MPCRNPPSQEQVDPAQRSMSYGIVTQKGQELPLIAVSLSVEAKDHVTPSLLYHKGPQTHDVAT